MACHIIFYADKLPFLLHLLLSENIFLPSLGRRAGRSMVLLLGNMETRKKRPRQSHSHQHTYVCVCTTHRHKEKEQKVRNATDGELRK